MNEFDDFYTLEFLGPKGWEIQWTGKDWIDCFNWFKRIDMENEYQVRLTNPKPFKPTNDNVVSFSEYVAQKMNGELDGAA